jgi:hypothetical protein
LARVAACGDCGPALVLVRRAGVAAGSRRRRTCCGQGRAKCQHRCIYIYVCVFRASFYVLERA